MLAWNYFIWDLPKKSSLDSTFFSGFQLLHCDISKRRNPLKKVESVSAVLLLLQHCRLNIPTVGAEDFVIFQAGFLCCFLFDVVSCLEAVADFAVK
jgi:hypothetical protein